MPVRDPVSVAESLVMAARTGARWDRDDLAFAAAVAFSDVPPSGAARVLSSVLREIVTRMAADFRSGIDIIDPVRSLIAGMPASVLAGAHRPESWHSLWVLLGDVARQRCSDTDPLIAAMVRCNAELTSHSSATAATRSRSEIGRAPLMAIAAKGASATGARAGARLRLRRKIEEFVT